MYQIKTVRPLYPVGYWAGMDLHTNYVKFFDAVTKVEVDLTKPVDNKLVEQLNGYINAKTIIKETK